MQAVREEVRRVVRLAAVRKITQLSPEALEAACNQALRAAIRHAPQEELAALDSEMRSLAVAFAFEQQLLRLVEGRGTQAGVAPSRAALYTLHMACYVAKQCGMQVRLQLVEVGARLLLVGGLVILLGTGSAEQAAGRLVTMHLKAAQTLLEMVVWEPQKGPCELYDAAQQAFQPDLTVKWLLQLTAYLAEAEADSEVWHRYVFVCKHLFNGWPDSKYLTFSAVQDMLDPESCTAIAQLLLQRTLPAVVAEVAQSMQQQQQQLEAGADAAAGDGSKRTGSANATTAEEQALKTVGWIGSLTKVPCLRAAMLQLASQDLTGAQRTACRLLAALPVACPPTLIPFVFCWAWQSAVEVLLLPCAAAEERSSERAASQQLAAGTVAAQCLPRLAAALRAAPASLAEADQTLGAMCDLATGIIVRILRAMLAFSSEQLHAQHCVTLLEATDAMLRTLPTLRSAQQAGKQQFQPTAAEQQAGGQQGQPTAMEQQQQQQQQAGKDDEPAKWAARAAAKLVGQCWSLLWHAVQLAHGQMQLHRRLSLLQQIPGNAQTSAMAAAAWKLHSTSCRWVHWAIAQGSVGDLSQWDATLRKLGGLVAELLTDEQAVQGAMAAHLAALEAIADAQGPLQEWQPQPAQQWAVHLAWLATRLEPDMWPPRLSVMLVEAGSFLVQSMAAAVDGNNPAKAPSAELVACLAEAADASAAEAPSAELVLTEWLGAIAGCPRAAYLMLTSGVLAQALAALEAAGGEKQAIQSAADLASKMCDWLPKGSPAAREVYAVDSRLAPLGAAAKEDNLTASELVDFSRILHSNWLPALVAVAAAQQQRREQRPWIQQAQFMLDGGLAAATRSCAYLRCANLGGKGGPAAGSGAGSAKCSACREAWYCGTACSHADWKLGHRRLCKAMAAWHQQQKEAAVQQRAEQRRPEVAGQG